MLRYQGNDLQMRFLFGALPCFKSVPFLWAFVSCPLVVPAAAAECVSEWNLSCPCVMDTQPLPKAPLGQGGRVLWGKDTLAWLG